MASLQDLIEQYLQGVESDYWRETIGDQYIDPSKYDTKQCYSDAVKESIKKKIDYDLERELFEECNPNVEDISEFNRLILLAIVNSPFLDFEIDFLYNYSK